MARPRVHLGIDYGTSASKIVMRDFAGREGDRARVLTERSTYRFPSAVALAGDVVTVGVSPSSTIMGARIFESVKMRAAAEVAGNAARLCYAPMTDLPDGLSAVDRATLTVARLVERGARAATRRFGEDVALGMTLGIPMSFFTDPGIREAFLRIARTGWQLYRSRALSSDSVRIVDARRLLGEARNAVDQSPLPNGMVRQWLCTEAQAALWWAVDSPAVPSGPYAKVDVGAGTTNASVFRIIKPSGYGNADPPRIAFLGADSKAFGMDSVDEKLALLPCARGRSLLELRGHEHELLTEQATRKACEAPINGIYSVFSRAWMLGHDKNKGSLAEVNRWKTAGVFVIGGGSHVRCIRDRMRAYPRDREIALPVRGIEPPPNLALDTETPVPADVLPFVIVAYGLSNLGLDFAEVRTPDEIAAMPSSRERREQLDHEDIYAK